MLFLPINYIREGESTSNNIEKHLITTHHFSPVLPTIKALTVPTNEAIKTIVYPVGKSKLYEIRRDAMINREPTIHANPSG